MDKNIMDTFQWLYWYTGYEKSFSINDKEFTARYPGELFQLIKDSLLDIREREAVAFVAFAEHIHHGKKLRNPNYFNDLQTDMLTDMIRANASRSDIIRACAYAAGLIPADEDDIVKIMHGGLAVPAAVILQDYSKHAKEAVEHFLSTENPLENAYITKLLLELPSKSWKSSYFTALKKLATQYVDTGTTMYDRLAKRLSKREIRFRNAAFCSLYDSGDELRVSSSRAAAAFAKELLKQKPSPHMTDAEKQLFVEFLDKQFEKKIEDDKYFIDYVRGCLKIQYYEDVSDEDAYLQDPDDWCFIYDRLGLHSYCALYFKPEDKANIRKWEALTERDKRNVFEYRAEAIREMKAPEKEAAAKELFQFFKEAASPEKPDEALLAQMYYEGFTLFLEYDLVKEPEEATDWLKYETRLDILKPMPQFLLDCLIRCCKRNHITPGWMFRIDKRAAANNEFFRYIRTEAFRDYTEESQKEFFWLGLDVLYKNAPYAYLSCLEYLFLENAKQILSGLPEFLPLCLDEGEIKTMAKEIAAFCSEWQNKGTVMVNVTGKEAWMKQQERHMLEKRKAKDLQELIDLQESAKEHISNLVNEGGINKDRWQYFSFDGMLKIIEGEARAKAAVLKYMEDGDIFRFAKKMANAADAAGNKRILKEMAETILKDVH